MILIILDLKKSSKNEVQDFQNRTKNLKIARAVQLHKSAIISARNNSFPWHQKQLVDITALYQKQLLSQFRENFDEDPGPLKGL